MGKLIFCIVACGLEICHKSLLLFDLIFHRPSPTHCCQPAHGAGRRALANNVIMGSTLARSSTYSWYPLMFCRRFKVVGKHKRSCRKIPSDFISGSVSQETTATFSRRRTNILSAFLHFQDGCIVSTHFGDVQLFLPCETWRTWQQEQISHQGWTDVREISMELQLQHRRATKTASNTALLYQRKCSQNGPKILLSIPSLQFFCIVSLFFGFYFRLIYQMPQGRDFLHFCHYIHWMGLGCRVFPGTWTQSHNDSAIRLNK